MSQLTLMQPESFAQQAAGTRALDRFANLASGNYAKAAAHPAAQLQPICNQTTIGDAFALRAGARKIPSVFDPDFTRQAQFSLSPGGHSLSGLDWRQTFTADAAAIRQNRAAAFRAVAGAEAVLPLAADFGWLILPFHKCLSV